MLSQTMLTCSLLLRPVVNSTRFTLVRNLSTTTTMLKENHKMKHPDAEDIKEQKEFDLNKKKLEKLEHGDHSNIMKPSMEKLQEEGENARIEQNRPDDGVY